MEKTIRVAACFAVVAAELALTSYISKKREAKKARTITINEYDEGLVYNITTLPA